MTTNPTEAGIRWDDTAIANLHLPNFCNVVSSPRDLTLLFGMTDPQPDAGTGEMTVQLRNRVVLRPVVAKLLATLLQNTLSEFEASHGVIDTGFQPLPGSRALTAPSPAPRTDALPLDDLPEKGALLLELIQGLGIRYEIERSFKVLRGAVFGNRFLLGFPTARLTPQARLRLPVICKRLGMPAEYSDAFQRDLETVDFVHFGFEEGDGGAVFKAYSEYTPPFVDALSAESGKLAEPTLLYLGYKWDAADHTKRAISRYLAHPALTPAGIEAGMARLLPGEANADALEICRFILDVALSRAAADKLLLVEVTEDGNPRVSFALNCYAANLQLVELYPVLLAICQRYALPLERFQHFYGQMKNQVFGHIAAGLDRDGNNFLTIYFGGRAPGR